MFVGFKSNHDAMPSVDSIIDILLCVVGFMVVIVLFTILSARGKMVEKSVTVTVVAPILQTSLKERNMIIVFCQDNRISVSGFDGILEEVVNSISTYSNSKEAIASFHEEYGKDYFFEYNLKAYATAEGLVKRRRSTDYILELRLERRGETLSQAMKSNSRFRKALGMAINGESWIHFLVDSTSLDLFLFGRDYVRSLGAFVGWEPVEIEFPLVEPITDTSLSDDRSIELIRGFQTTSQ